MKRPRFGCVYFRVFYKVDVRAVDVKSNQYISVPTPIPTKLRYRLFVGIRPTLKREMPHRVGVYFVFFIKLM